MNIIEMHQVDFSYDQSNPTAGGTKALSGITLGIAPGEFVALVGGEGSGKSTFLKLCNALLLPSAGTVSLLGIESDHARRWEIRRRSGLILPDPGSQIIGATVTEDIAFGPENLGLPPQVIRERVQDALQALSLEELADAETHHLSGTQKFRLALAGVIAMHPDCLLVDEASTALASKEREEISALLRTLHLERGLTIILATRDVAEITTADRVILLDRGIITLDGTPAQFFSCGSRIDPAAPETPESIEPQQPWATHAQDKGPDQAHQEAGRRTGHILTDAVGYSHGESLLHRADPRTKIALTLLIIAAIFVLRSFTSLVLMLTIVFTLSALSGKPLRHSLRGLKLVVYLALVAVVVNLVSIKGTPLLDYGFLRHIAREAVEKSATMVLRLALLASTAALLTSTTPPFALAAGGEKLLQPLSRIKVPVSKFATILLISLRFLPVILEEAARLIKLQSAGAIEFTRGNPLQRIKSCLPLLVPLLQSVAHRADVMATALDARCYRGSLGRTRMRPLAFSAADLICAGVALVILLALACVEKAVLRSTF